MMFQAINITWHLLRVGNATFVTDSAFSASTEFFRLFVVVIGAVLTAILAPRYLDRKRRQDEQAKLRNALIAEIDFDRRLNIELKYRQWKGEKKGDFYATDIPSRIFDSNTSNIGLLDKNEARKTIDYYNIVNIANRQINEIKTADTEEEREGSPRVNPKVLSYTQGTLPQLREKRREALNALGANISSDNLSSSTIQDTPLSDLYVDENELEEGNLATTLRGIVGIDKESGEMRPYKRFYEFDTGKRITARLLYRQAAFRLEFVSREALGEKPKKK